MDSLQRILYVEDEPDIQAIAQIALESLGGFELKVCSSGEEAIKAADSFKPDLLLLDVMMPGMDGPRTLAALRRRSATAETPVIFMTAKVQPNEIDHLKSCGALDVIPKPFDPMTLSDQVRAIWHRGPVGT
ncbi:response regulator [Marinimicrobium agarilyticum]|uniref:response regulator n=1 Tax=Marinimicrobium agarilyticum TaxID=306546 RepID=UPI0004243FD2|nr:response regulator [Marinimicrobium agarilyticum]